eukprot:scaffold85861_cov45-Cyclotella_meneghiniana.AAC.1
MLRINPSPTPIKQHPLQRHPHRFVPPLHHYSHSIRRVLSSLSDDDDISANTRPKRKAAAAAQRDWIVTPSPPTVDGTGNSPMTSESDAGSNKRQRTFEDANEAESNND